jgi:hypothetical protein
MPSLFIAHYMLDSTYTGTAMQNTQILLIGNEVIAVTLALIGGVGSFLQSCRTGEGERTLFNFMTEIVLAIITGLALLYLGTWLKWEPALINTLVLLLTNNSSDTLIRGKLLLFSVLKHKLNSGNKNG